MDSDKKTTIQNQILFLFVKVNLTKIMVLKKLYKILHFLNPNNFHQNKLVYLYEDKLIQKIFTLIYLFL